ncbi:MAG: hypothetical protein R3A80_00965 [Bdellovibrionota bacterium]
MKKLLITALFGAFAVAQETAPEAAPSNHSVLYQLDATTVLDGNKYQGDHFIRYSYKFADGYKLMPAVLLSTDYARANSSAEWHDTFANQYVRVELDTPKFWDIVGFKTGVRLRYYVPTTVGDESYGTLSARLMMEQEFNSHFNLTLIPKLNMYLQRNGYNRASGDRNNIVGLALEILPQYKFSEDLTLTYDFEISGKYLGDSFAGDNNTIVKSSIYHEIEFMYNIASAGDLGLGLIAFNEFAIGNHSQAEVAKDNETNVGIRLAKSLDL